MFTRLSNINSRHDEDIVAATEFFRAIKEKNSSLLLEYFGNPSIKIWQYKEADGYTCLHRSVFMDSFEITKLIIEEIKKRLGFGQSNQLSKFMNEKTSEGYTALHYASCKGNIQIAKFLIENGATVEATTNRGKNVMHLSAESNQPSIMVYFIHYQAQDVFSIDECGSTPLHWACYSGAEETVSFLLSLKVCIDAKDKEGYTPLHLAVQSVKEKIVLKLLQNGADKNIKNLHGETPLDIAVKKKYYKIISILDEQDFNPLCTLEMPVNYIHPENIYKKFIWLLIIIPEFFTVFLILPFMNDDQYQYSIFVNLILFSLSLISYFLLLTFESGYAKNDDLIKDANGENPLKFLIDQNEDIKKFCPICYIRKCSNIKHCFICDKCVEGFEHHCFWLNKCIGKGNKVPYVIFIIVNLFYALFSVYISCLCIFSDFNIIEHSNFFFWINSDTDFNGFRILGSAFVLCYSIILSFPLFFLFLIKIFKMLGWFKKKNLEDELVNKNKKIIDSEKSELYIEMNKHEELLNKENEMGENDNIDDNLLLNNNIINNDNDDKERNFSNKKNNINNNNIENDNNNIINNEKDDIIINNNDNKKEEEEEKLNQDE